jgi:AcrR family transcriptional regulator
VTVARPTTAIEAWRAYDALPLTPILEASLAAFQEHGYHGTTIRDIASRVGITMPTLYYHHGSKEGILAAVLDVGMDDLRQHLDGALAAAGDDTEKKLRNFVTAVSLHETRRQDIARIHPESRFLGAEARQDYITRRNAVTAILVDILDTGTREGAFDAADSHFTARGIFAMLQGTPQWYRDGGPDDPDAIAAKYVEVVLRMVGATNRPER